MKVANKRKSIQNKINVIILFLIIWSAIVVYREEEQQYWYIKV